MGSWDEATTFSGSSMLPAGTRNYTITSAHGEVNEYNSKRQIVFALSSAEGNGKHILDLEASPNARDPKAALEVVESIIKGDLQALGFTPTTPTADISQVIVPEFMAHLHTYVGSIVEVWVKHEEYSGKDGETKTKQKSRLNKLVQKGAGAIATQTQTPILTGGGGGTAADDDIPFDTCIL